MKSRWARQVSWTCSLHLVQTRISTHTQTLCYTAYIILSCHTAYEHKYGLVITHTSQSRAVLCDERDLSHRLYLLSNLELQGNIRRELACLALKQAESILCSIRSCPPEGAGHSLHAFWAPLMWIATSNKCWQEIPSRYEIDDCKSSMKSKQRALG